MKLLKKWNILRYYSLYSLWFLDNTVYIFIFEDIKKRKKAEKVLSKDDCSHILFVEQSLSHIGLLHSKCNNYTKSDMTYGLQHVRLPQPSLSPGVCSTSCPLSQWCYQSLSSSAAFFFCLQSFPESRSFLMFHPSHQVAKVLELQRQHQSFQ